MTGYAFTERGAHEAGFGEVFQQRIVPILRRHEDARAELKRKTVRAMWVTGAVAALGLVALIWLRMPVLGVVALILGGIGVLVARSYYEGKWKSGLGSEVLPILCEFLGDMRHGEQRVGPAVFSRLGVVPLFERAALEDPVTGQHRGLDWAMTEAKLTSRSRDTKGRTKTTTVFRGLLFQIAVLNPAPRIFFGRDRGALINQISETLSGSRQGLGRVEIPDAEFEKVYEVYSDDPEAAFAYITPDLVEGLKRLAAAEQGGNSYVSCAFEGDWFYLALERKGDFLSMGSLFRPMTEMEEDLHGALADLDLPRRVIDTLTGR